MIPRTSPRRRGSNLYAIDVLQRPHTGNSPSARILNGGLVVRKGGLYPVIISSMGELYRYYWSENRDDGVREFTLNPDTCIQEINEPEVTR